MKLKKDTTDTIYGDQSVLIKYLWNKEKNTKIIKLILLPKPWMWEIQIIRNKNGRKKREEKTGTQQQYQSIIRHSPTFFTNNRNLSKTKQNKTHNPKCYDSVKPNLKINKQTNNILGANKRKQTHMKKSHNKKKNQKCTSKVGLGEENHT